MLGDTGVARGIMLALIDVSGFHALPAPARSGQEKGIPCLEKVLGNIL